MNRYKIKVYSGDRTERLIVEHTTDTVKDAKFYFFHWISEYYRTEMNCNRTILISEVWDETDKEFRIAKCRIFKGGEIGVFSCSLIG